MSDKVARSSTATRIQVGVLDNLIWVITLALFAIFSLTIPHFFTGKNIQFMFYDAAAIGMLVFAEAIALISGNLDLSVARNSGLTAMFVGMLLTRWVPGIPGWAGIILMPAVGGMLGAINGFFVGRVKLDPFLVTLSTFLMFDWTTYVINKGAIINLAPALVFPGGEKLFGIFFAIVVLFAVFGVMHFVLEQTRFGGYIRAIGGNAEAAGMNGINVPWMNFWVFTLAGTLAGVAALLYTGYLESIPSTIASGDAIFLAFAGAIIGGVSLHGGEGSIVGAFGGVLLLGVIDTGTAMTNVDPAVRGVINGAILLLAILIDRFRVTLRDRLLLPSRATRASPPAEERPRP